MWTCNPEWPASTVYIVGGGPSVRGLDLEGLRGRKVITINSSVFAVSFADIAFFGDSRWYHEHRPRLTDFKGRIVSNSPSVREPPVLQMRKLKPPPGIAAERDALAMQYTSMQAAINLGVHLGATRMVLLGLDGKPDGKGRTHHHEPHPWRVLSNCWDLQRQSMQSTVKPLRRLGVEIVNANPDSAYDWWPKMPFTECLARFA